MVIKTYLEQIQNTNLQEKIRKSSADGEMSFQWQEVTSHNQSSNLQFEIQFNKEIPKNENQQWIYYKSLNLPTITVEAKQKKFSSSFGELKAQIFAVSDKGKKNVLKLEQLRGAQEIKLEKGVGTFERLKFAQTSYCNQNHDYFLVVIIYKVNQQSNERREYVQVSAPIKVLSKKQNSIKSLQITESLIVPPHKLDDELYKIVSKTDKRMITNCVEGLYNYLSIPRRRKQILNPLFLYLKFSNIFTLYVNSQLLDLQNVRPEKVYQRILETLKSYEDQNLSSEKLLFVLHCDTSKEKVNSISMSKLIKYLDEQNNRFYAVTYSQTQKVPANFVALPEMGSKNILYYKKAYHRVMNPQPEGADLRNRYLFSKNQRCIEINVNSLIKDHEKSGLIKIRTIQRPKYQSQVQDKAQAKKFEFEKKRLSQTDSAMEAENSSEILGCHSSSKDLMPIECYLN